MTRSPVAAFAVTALAIALTAGFGLGLWLLLARVWGVSLLGTSWLALVQVHGLVQLFGFLGLFAMGIALHALPRFRGAPAVAAPLVWTIYATTVLGLALRSLAQPVIDLPGREVLLVIAGLLLVVGTGTFTVASLLTLARGRNPHRSDELVIGAGLGALPVAAVLVAFEMMGLAPLVVNPGQHDRAVWTMLLGCLATLVFGVWARLAPASSRRARLGRRSSWRTPRSGSPVWPCSCSQVPLARGPCSLV